MKKLSSTPWTQLLKKANIPRFTWKTKIRWSHGKSHKIEVPSGEGYTVSRSHESTKTTFIFNDYSDSKKLSSKAKQILEDNGAKIIYSGSDGNLECIEIDLEESQTIQ